MISDQHGASYSFLRPQKMQGKFTLHPVVIVGAGPIGLTLALTLEKAGVACVLLEDDHTVCEGSRAIGMSRRTLEIWDSLEAIDEIVAKGLDWKGGRSFYKEHEILNFQMADDLNLMYRPMFNIQQSLTEQFLVNKVNQRPLIDLRWQSRLMDFEDKGDCLELTVQTPKGDYKAQSKYIVACDGAKSSVRSLMDIHLEGTSYEATYLIVDIKLDTNSPIERRCWFDAPSNPGLTVLMHGQPGGVWRLDFQLGEHEDVNESLKDENIILRIQSHLDYIKEHGDWELVWRSPYKVHSRSLDVFNHGKVIFAGDAAHLMPIFGIRGLNSGVEDAWNLGWKLAQVIKNQSPVQLLDAYSYERKKVFLENAALANRNALFMTPPNAGIRLLRDAVLSLALGETVVQDILNPKQATYVPLRDSVLSVLENEKWEKGPKVGEVIPDVKLLNPVDAKRTHLQKVIELRTCGFYFVNELNDEKFEADLKILSAFNEFDLILISKSKILNSKYLNIVDPILHDLFDMSEGGFCLVRVDHHIAARWRHLETNLIKKAIDTIQGFHLLGKPLKKPEFIDVPYTQSEETYKLLGNALNGIDSNNQGLLLMKLCLIQALEQNNIEKFKRNLEVALKDIN